MLSSCSDLTAFIFCSDVSALSHQQQHKSLETAKEKTSLFIRHLSNFAHNEFEYSAISVVYKFDNDFTNYGLAFISTSPQKSFVCNRFDTIDVADLECDTNGSDIVMTMKMMLFL